MSTPPLDLEELQAFLAVASAGSVRAAAEATRTPRSTLRRRLDALEARIGSALFLKDERGTSLTVPGQALYERGVVLVERGRALLSFVQGMGGRDTTPIRLALAPGPPRAFLLRSYAGVRAVMPGLVLDLCFDEDPIRLLKSGRADLAIHIGDQVPEGPWVAFVVTRMKVRLFASTDYLARHGTPTSVDDLDDHEILCWSGSPSRTDGVRLLGGGHHPVIPRLVSTDLDLLREAVRTGLGIGWLLDVPFPGDARHAVVPVLEGTVGDEVPAWLAVSQAVHDMPVVRSLVSTFRDIARVFMSA